MTPSSDRESHAAAPRGEASGALRPRSLQRFFRGAPGDERVRVEGTALRRADRLAVAALGFVLLGAIGGGILEIVYALIE